jgi:hypothetical protein
MLCVSVPQVAERFEELEQRISDRCTWIRTIFAASRTTVFLRRPLGRGETLDGQGPLGTFVPMNQKQMFLASW